MAGSEADPWEPLAGSAGPRVRPMREADVPAVLAIERRAYDYPWSERIFRDCLAAGYTGLVYADGRPEAYLFLDFGVGEAHILNLVVDPGRQRRGVGGLLLETALERARGRGMETLFLEVRPSNGPACRLYQRYGFNEVGRRPGYYPGVNGREDALIMARVV